MWMNRSVAIACVVAVAGTLATWLLLWLSEVPLGISSEWAWPRVPWQPGHPYGFVVAGTAGLLYLAFVVFGRQRFHQSGMLERGLWVNGLIVLAVIMLWNTFNLAPGPYGTARAPYVLYYPRMSGYFTQARQVEKQAWKDWLGDYDEQMREGDHLHIGTHPPGLIAMYRLVWRASRNSTFRSAVLATEPYEARESFQSLEVDDPTNRIEATLWFVAFATLVMSQLTILPLYGLLRAFCDANTTWKAIAFWPTVPTVIVFWPKSDLVYPFIAMLFLCSSVWGLKHRDYWLSILSGGIAWLGLVLSLAFSPFLLMFALLTAAETLFNRSIPWKNRLISFCRHGCAIVLGLLLPTLLVYWQFDLNLPMTWWYNYQNHALFYGDFPRTYWAWLLVNPLELAFSLGIPLFLAGMLGMLGAFGQRRPSTSTLLNFVVIPLGVWGLLWLSGKNMGEAARLWILLMPLWIVPVAACRPSDEQNDHRKSEYFWLILLGAQLVCVLLTASRIDGFGFSEFAGG